MIFFFVIYIFHRAMGDDKETILAGQKIYFNMFAVKAAMNTREMIKVIELSYIKL